MKTRVGWMVLWVGLSVLSSGTLVAQERWVYRYNGPGNYDDWARSLVMGSDGNLYAAGYSIGSGTWQGFTVVSLTPSGDERWVYRYNGPGNGDDRAYSIVMGWDGNVYAAGCSYGSGSGDDFTVVSLTPSGDERWVYRYNGPGNGNDRAYSIVMGWDGNVYAAGCSYGSGTWHDFTIISLSASGGERWVYRHNGPGDNYDGAYSIATGWDGNLYAAGVSIGSGTSYDFTVISLTPSGGERWVYRYNGPGNDYDWAYSIVTGSDGNLYAAGASIGSGTSYDFTVISLTASGDERWVYRYNGPKDEYDWAYSIVTGSDSNVYAAGASIGSGTSHDFTVISLTASGGERWVYRYNGPGDNYDEAYSIVMGSDGSLYAAGVSIGSGTSYDFTVISLTPSGDERWVYRYNGPGDNYDEAYSIVVGSDGNLYGAGCSIGSGAGYDFTVISLTPSGDERWVYRYDGPGNSDDWARSIVMGSDGNLYAAGDSYRSGTWYDFTVISLTPSGDERWLYRYNGAGSEDDRAYSIVMGSDSNLYAAGWSYGSGTWYDFTVISLTPSGDERWLYRYNGPGNESDVAYSIVAGLDGNLYAAGVSIGGGTWRDFTVISLSASGDRRWLYRYNGPGNDSDVAYSIIIGSDGNLYAAGCSIGRGTWGDFTVVSLTPSGEERWVYRYDGPGNRDDRAYSIVMGSDGNLYAAGWSIGSATGYDFAVISLTASGDERWVYRYSGPKEECDGAHSIVMGSDGNLYAAGRSIGSGTGDDFLVISLTPSGDKRWLYRYNGPGNSDDWAYSIVAGSDGNLYAAGASIGSGTSYDFTVISLTASGDERWLYRYNGPGDDYDEAYSIAMGSDSNLYAAGRSRGSGTGYDFAVISLASDVGVEEKPACPEPSRQEAKLAVWASPNPAVGGVRIHYSVQVCGEAEEQHINLSVYDVCGKLVRNLVNTEEERGSKVVVWDGKDASGGRVASGTYFVRLSATHTAGHTDGGQADKSATKYGRSASRKLVIF